MACRQARDAQAQLAESSTALDSAEVEMTQLKALAAERQKRFVMLNGTFKKKEDGLRQRVEAAERQVADAEREFEAAQAQAASAIQVQKADTRPATLWFKALLFAIVLGGGAGRGGCIAIFAHLLT